MSLTLFTLVVTLLGATYLWLKKHYSYWADRNVAHEKPVFLLGNMKGLGSKYHWREINQRVYKRFKGSERFVGFYTFLSQSAFILDLDMIKQIMIKDFATFADRGLFHNVRDDPLTENLLFLDGEQWRTLRQKLSPVFTTGKIKYMFPTMVSIGERLVATCSKLIEADQGEIEAKDLCARYTTDVIGTCAFGIECNSLSDPNAEFRRMGRSIFEQPRHSLPVQAFMFTNPELARRLRMKNFSDEASAFFMNAVRETVEYREKNGVKRNDFMDILIELKAQRDKLGDSAESHDDLSNGLTLQQVAAQAMVFFMAGFDTSSTTMAFCMYELALNTAVQEKLRTEIVEVLGKHDNVLTYECLKEMFYLEMVISETLRKYSVLPHLVRRTVTEYKVPNSNVTFEKGLRIILPIDCIHNDPDLYPQPEKFIPERFTPEEIAKRHPFAYLPFGDGPRNCIGMRFGRLQAEIGIITLLRHYRLSASARTQIPMQYSNKSFLAAPESGVYLSVEKL